jgi:hypothetical protein
MPGKYTFQREMRRPPTVKWLEEGTTIHIF